MNTFSAMGSLRAGWATFKKRPGAFIGAILCVIIATWIASAAAKAFGDQGVGAAAGGIINFVASMLIGMGEAAFFLKAERAPETATVRDLWHPRPFWKYVGAALVVGIVAGAAAAIFALILVVMPSASQGAFNPILVAAGVLVVIIAFAVAVRLQFAQYFVIEKQLWPLEAVKASFRITKGHFGQLLGLLVLLIIINLLGAIALVIGLLVSMPVTMLAVVHAYRSLSREA